MSMTQEELALKILSDAAFRDELKRDPNAALEAAGMRIPEGVEFEVVESTPTKRYLVLPPLQDGEIDEAALASVQGGTDAAAAYSPICTGPGLLC